MTVKYEIQREAMCSCSDVAYLLTQVGLWTYRQETHKQTHAICCAVAPQTALPSRRVTCHQCAQVSITFGRLPILVPQRAGDKSSALLEMNNEPVSKTGIANVLSEYHKSDLDDASCAGAKQLHIRRDVFTADTIHEIFRLKKNPLILKCLAGV